MPDYDLITVGGGLGGSALARSMAQSGARVLVLERETKFKDRVRGEGVTRWGAGDARDLGVYDIIKSACGHELPWWDTYLGSMQIMHRDMPSTTPQALPSLAFYHPAMQETLLQAASHAGADVRRGVRASAVTPGPTPAVTVQHDNAREERLEARLIVGADGRTSMMRKWGGFTEQRDDDRLRISGLLLEGTHVPEDTVRLIADVQRGRGGIVVPQGGNRARVYLMMGVAEGLRLQGEKDVPAFIDASIASGMPPEYFEGAQPAGPLATFDGADCWVEHPYRDGVALVGDAAASSDPSWGQGLSLTLRDARVLRDALLASDDWDAAAHSYASKHDRYYGIIHTVEDWLTQLFYETGPQADARRAKAFPLLVQDPTRQPDALFSGPDQPVDETARRRFFGEE